MGKGRKLLPLCSKCGRIATYDRNPDLPIDQQVGIDEDEYGYAFTVGNAKYYCSQCDRTWKKYRGRKPYQKIKVVHAYTGGFPSPYFQVTIDLTSNTLDKDILNEDYEDASELKDTISDDEVQWFRDDLYKCDFLNWSEEYHDPLVLDGSHWEVRIEFDTYCERKVGNNHFPKKWTKFCKTISKLSGGEFY